MGKRKTKALAVIPKPKPRAKAKATRKRVGPDPTGRLDIMASGLVRVLAERSNDPTVTVIYRHSQGLIDDVIRECLGPQNKTARTVTRTIRKGVQFLGDVEKEKARRQTMRARA